MLPQGRRTDAVETVTCLPSGTFLCTTPKLQCAVVGRQLAGACSVGDGGQRCHRAHTGNSAHQDGVDQSHVHLCMCSTIAGGMHCAWHGVFDARRLGRGMCGHWQDVVHAAHRLRAGVASCLERRRRRSIWRRRRPCYRWAMSLQRRRCGRRLLPYRIDHHPALRRRRITAWRTGPDARPATQPPHPLQGRPACRAAMLPGRTRRR